jgi:antirestriction protein ArdC
MNEKFIDPYKIVTDTIIAQLEKGMVPWRCPWRKDVGMPRNFHTGQQYHGINVILLTCRRFASPYWMTWNQIKQRGGSVLKGEHGSIVVKYGEFKRKTATDDTAKEKPRYYLKGYKVFNALQIKGIDFPAVPSIAPTLPEQRLEMAEVIVAGMPSPPQITESRHIAARYRRLSDTVDMPGRGSFDAMENFYLTLFHELVHSTGHESRLNRKSLIENDGFGGKVYSEEELVAEMGAAFLGAEADIVLDDHEQSAAYLRGWLDALKDEDHKRWIVKAANQAAKAADFITNRTPAVESLPQPAAA